MEVVGWTTATRRVTPRGRQPLRQDPWHRSAGRRGPFPPDANIILPPVLSEFIGFLMTQVK